MVQYDPETKQQSKEWSQKTCHAPKTARKSKSKIESILITFFWTFKVLRIKNLCLKDRKSIKLTTAKFSRNFEKGYSCLARDFLLFEASSP